MKKIFVITAICLLILLAACGSKTTGKRVAIPETSSSAPAITAAAVADTTPAKEAAPAKSAAETLKELQSSPVALSNSSKSGTFYPPVATSATGKDALAEKTRALMANATYDPNVKADDQFGARYHNSNGELRNLPSGYSGG